MFTRKQWVQWEQGQVQRVLGDLSSEGTALLPPLTLSGGLSLRCLSGPGLVWATQPCGVGLGIQKGWLKQEKGWGKASMRWLLRGP